MLANTKMVKEMGKAPTYFPTEINTLVNFEMVKDKARAH